MSSTFTWLDYSESERRKMLDVIELFGERATRDELGLGGIRDAFADLLFPGTSTIQTRARYFLFVPWAYLDLERRRTPSAKARQRGREHEAKLISALAQSGDPSGLIGRLAGGNIQRLPSSVYWQGLVVWGIRLFPGSQDEYHRSLDLFYARRKSRRTERSDFDGEAEADPEPRNWHAGLPPAPKDFPEGARFALRREEAEYLRERILQSCPDSLLAHLLRERIPVRKFDWAWEFAGAAPDHLRDPLRHGRNFSEVLHGAQLLYNLLLAERRERSEWIDDYRERLDDWWGRIHERRIELQAWDLPSFWRLVYLQNPRVSARAKSFVDRWVNVILGAGSLSAVADGAEARTLVEHREVQLKGPLARLRNDRACELWPGAAGAAQLDLRWTAARRILADILDGLEAQPDA